MRAGAIILATALALAACAAPTPPPATDPPALILADVTLARTERFPRWLVRIAEANPGLTRSIGLIQFRPGRLPRHPAALALVTDALSPLDIVVFHSENRMSGLLLPGQFTHGAIYLGTEAQLRDAGLWHHPALGPHRAAIAAGDVFLEAIDGGVQLNSASEVFDTDAVAVLRPPAADRGPALARGLAQMGVPFDMGFDAADPGRLFCVELIALAYPSLALPHCPVYGRDSLLVDTLVLGALTGDQPLGFVGYVEANPRGGVRALSAADLALRLRMAWAE